MLDLAAQDPGSAQRRSVAPYRGVPLGVLSSKTAEGRQPISVAYYRSCIGTIHANDAVSSSLGDSDLNSDLGSRRHANGVMLGSDSFADPSYLQRSMVTDTVGSKSATPLRVLGLESDRSLLRPLHFVGLTAPAHHQSCRFRILIKFYGIGCTLFISIDHLNFLSPVSKVLFLGHIAVLIK